VNMLTGQLGRLPFAAEAATSSSAAGSRAGFSSGQRFWSASGNRQSSQPQWQSRASQGKLALHATSVLVDVDSRNFAAENKKRSAPELQASVFCQSLFVALLPLSSISQSHDGGPLLVFCSSSKDSPRPMVPFLQLFIVSRTRLPPRTSLLQVQSSCLPVTTVSWTSLLRRWAETRPSGAAPSPFTSGLRQVGTKLMIVFVPR